MFKGGVLNCKGGFSLIEVILTTSIFALIITGLVGAFIYGQETTSLSGSRVRAIFLAEEGLEAVRNIRDNNFLNLVDGFYGLDSSSNEWILTGTNDTKDIFTRQIAITTVSPGIKQVISNVNWQQNLQRNGSVELITYLTDWRSASTPVIFDCLEFCQSLNYINGTCRQNEQQCLKNGEIYEAGGDQYCLFGPQADSCCCQ